MSRARLRWTMAGALALAAAGVAGGFAPAEARGKPSDPSPYAGSYSGTIRYGGTGGQQGGGAYDPYWRLDVTISSAGKIAGVADYVDFVSPLGDGAATGSVSTSGTIKLSVSDGTARESMNAKFTVDANGVIVAYESGDPGAPVVTLTPK